MKTYLTSKFRVDGFQDLAFLPNYVQDLPSTITLYYDKQENRRDGDVRVEANQPGTFVVYVIFYNKRITRKCLTTK